MARIDLSSEQLQGYLQRVRNLKTPPELRVERRPASKLSRDIATISNTLPKPQELKLHPEAPSIEQVSVSIEQQASSLAVLYDLFPQARGLIKQALKEQNLLGAMA